MEGKPSELITVPQSRKLARRKFFDGSNARMSEAGGSDPAVARAKRPNEVPEIFRRHYWRLATHPC
jgi:hypothetical protein